MRNLAKRTQDSTQEIQSMIERLQTSAQKATQSMSTSISTSEKAVEQSGQTSESINQLLALIIDVSAVGSELESRAQGQLLVIVEADDRISAIAELSQTALSEARSTISG